MLSRIFYKLRRLHVGTQKGFSLVVAILACLILTALGYLAVNVSTQDIRVSARVVGEKKAMAATETGVHQLMANFNPQTHNTGNWNSQAFRSGSSVSDPTSQYTMTCPSLQQGGSGSSSFRVAGYDIGGEVKWVQKPYQATVTGTSTKYSSSSQVQVGIGVLSPE